MVASSHISATQAQRAQRQVDKTQTRHKHLSQGNRLWIIKNNNDTKCTKSKFACSVYIGSVSLSIYRSRGPAEDIVGAFKLVIISSFRGQPACWALWKWPAGEVVYDAQNIFSLHPTATAPHSLQTTRHTCIINETTYYNFTTSAHKNHTHTRDVAPSFWPCAFLSLPVRLLLLATLRYGKAGRDARKRI